ncbi:MULTISPECIES: TfoX/Sxy family protein [Microbacterium]|uniref:TfoX/Sxy family protein n=1 Tax=Microbacterium TaxID=33882 RepID=UPI00217DEF2F|nr:MULTISPECIES: TfoX/Sxy family protein [Microbacterium]UWF77646.1 hypothetical protein JSY13_00695 [Microbacterium neungamense]WCM55815.1 hypothetical protein JRG78_00705 [Microbacterium sp. EF45047]
MIADEELLQEIAGMLDHDGMLDIGTMFRRPGIRADGKIVAFLGADDRMITKVPRERALELIAAGEASEVTMGKRTMREWISVPAAADRDGTLARWTPLVREALAYVTSLGGGA